MAEDKKEEMETIIVIGTDGTRAEDKKEEMETIIVIGTDGKIITITKRPVQKPEEKKRRAVAFTQG